jgi:predicted enzyme related to lactoylglutathione lyase
MDEQATAGRVLQMRLVVEAPDYEQAVAFYRDVLGALEAGESSAAGCVRGD